MLVGIEGSFNLGVIARTCFNFNVKELYLVNPVARIEEALRYSARGRELLEKCIVVNTLDEALKGVDVSVATSAIGYSEGDVVRQAISIEDFVERVASRVEKIALIFGRESTGLTREELLKADFLVTIPANPEYPVLNVSQSVAIFLWELWKKSGVRSSNIPPRATREEVESVLNVLNEVTSRVITHFDKRKRCGLVLKSTLFRSALSAQEARVLLYWARKINRKLYETKDTNKK